MSRNRDRMAKRRMRGSYLTTVMGIALVLFMLGALGLMLLNAQKLADHVKENIRIQVFLKNDAKDVTVAKLQKHMDASEYSRKAILKTKEQAAEELKAEVGQDFIDFLDGFNPLPHSIELSLQSAYAHPDSMEWIVKELEQQASVKEVVYSRDLITKVNENAKTISLVLLGFSAVLLLIAVALINNTIRLAMYSKRFLIRSMQLVGATRGFIQRPFLTQGMTQGILGALIAMGMLAGLLYLGQREMPEIMEFQDRMMMVKLFGAITLMGILIAFVSTFFAVNRYIRMKLDDLY